MANSYIPRSDAGALKWMKALAGGIAARPSAFMVTPGDAAALSGAVDEFEAAWTKANCPETRTKSAVSEKDQTRNSAEEICRQYCSLIKVNAGISDQAKIDIGVRPVNRGRIPIRCPQSSPLLDTIGCTPGRQVLRYHDSSTPDSCAKPFGATELQLFVAISDGPPADRSEAKLVGKFTRNPIRVEFESADGGKKATYHARWVSRRGEVGPWSLPVSMHIAA